MINGGPSPLRSFTIVSDPADGIFVQEFSSESSVMLVEVLDKDILVLITGVKAIVRNAPDLSLSGFK